MQAGNGSGLGAGVGGVEVGVHRRLTRAVGGQLKGPPSTKGVFSSPAWAGHGPQRPDQVWPPLMPPGRGPQGSNTPLQAQAVDHSAESLCLMTLLTSPQLLPQDLRSHVKGC